MGLTGTAGPPASATRWTGRRVLLLALVADLVGVLAFAAAGRRSHEPGESALVVLVIAWPFAVAALAAHAGLVLRGVATTSVRAGVVVVATTFVLGMALRALSGRGLAPAFLVVAALSLAVALLGWRGALAVLRRRRARRP